MADEDARLPLRRYGLATLSCIASMLLAAATMFAAAAPGIAGDVPDRGSAAVPRTGPERGTADVRPAEAPPVLTALRIPTSCFDGGPGSEQAKEAVEAEGVRIPAAWRSGSGTFERPDAAPQVPCARGGSPDGFDRKAPGVGRPLPCSPRSGALHGPAPPDL